MILRSSVDLLYNIIGARDFVNRMKSVVIFFDNSWLGGWYDIPPSSFYTVEVPFPKTRPEFTPLPSLDEIWSDVSFNLDQFQTNLTHISELAALNVEIFRENIKEKLLDTPSLVPRDYDPPDYVGRNNSTRSTGDEYVAYRTETEVSSFMLLLCVFVVIHKIFHQYRDFLSSPHQP